VAFDGVEDETALRWFNEGDLCVGGWDKEELDWAREVAQNRHDFTRGFAKDHLTCDGKDYKSDL